MKTTILRSFIIAISCLAIALNASALSATVYTNELPSELAVKIPKLPILIPAETAIPQVGSYHPGELRDAVPPADLSISLNSGTIILSWSGVPAATRYIVEASDAANTGYVDVTSTGNIYNSMGTVSWSIESVIAHRFYRVKSAIDIAVEGFITVQGGTFNNGVADVTLSSFQLGQYELTQAAYTAVMGSNPAAFIATINAPVEQVSWMNAIEYCNRRSLSEALTPCYGYNDGTDYGTNPATWPLGWNAADSLHINVLCNWTANGYRLPTEMEWMFAARGGNQTHAYLYSGSDDIDAVAWWGAYYGGNSNATTHTVGTKAANELDFYDMSGNIFEHVWDIKAAYPTGAQTNPHGAVSGAARVLKGGSWLHDTNKCTVAYQGNGNAPAMYWDMTHLGFRLCRNVPIAPIPESFVPVEGGTFNNGTSNVTISTFYLDKYEVMQNDYQNVMGVNPSQFNTVLNGPVDNVSWSNALKYCNLLSMNAGLTPCYSYSTFGTNPANWPVGWDTDMNNHVNWACNWSAAGYRLPTEMEWMFAARGGNLVHTPTAYTYSGSNTISLVAWYLSNSLARVHTVGTKASNELGLFDMSGNLAERVWDAYNSSYPAGAQTNPTGPALSNGSRVVRGGSWQMSASNCTVSARLSSDTVGGYNTVGFRICRKAS